MTFLPCQLIIILNIKRLDSVGISLPVPVDVKSPAEIKMVQPHKNAEGEICNS